MRKCLGTILIVIMSLTLFFATPCQASPDDYLIWYHEQYNEDGSSLMIVWLYRMTEAEPNYDFYIVKFRVIGMDSDPYGADDCSVEGWIVSNGVVNDWEPKAGFYGSPASLSISVGGVGFGINIPGEIVATTDGFTPCFGWSVSTLIGSPDKEFICTCYVPDGEAFAFLVAGLEWSHCWEQYTDGIEVYYPYVFGFNTLDVQAGAYGTTHPKPGTYPYPAGFNAYVWACPYEGYSLDYWKLEELTEPGGGGVGWYVDGSYNPIIQTMDRNYRVTAYFYIEPIPVTLDISSTPVSTAVYIDGDWRGSTINDPLTVTVQSGWHTIKVQDVVYVRKRIGPHKWTAKKYEFDYWTISSQPGMHYHNNPIELSVSVDGEHLTAVYYYAGTVTP